MIARASSYAATARSVQGCIELHLHACPTWCSYNVRLPGGEVLILRSLLRFNKAWLVNLFSQRNVSVFARRCRLPSTIPSQGNGSTLTAMENTGCVSRLQALLLASMHAWLPQVTRGTLSRVPAHPSRRWTAYLVHWTRSSQI